MNKYILFIYFNTPKIYLEYFSFIFNQVNNSL